MQDRKRQDMKDYRKKNVIYSSYPAACDLAYPVLFGIIQEFALIS